MRYLEEPRETETEFNWNWMGMSEHEASDGDSRNRIQTVNTLEESHTRTNICVHN